MRSLWLGTVPYREAWHLQTQLAVARAGDEIDDTLVLVEHPPVYTMGRNGNHAHLGRGSEHLLQLGAEYVEIDRGGSVTFHGPGQLVAYPIIRLAEVFPTAGRRAGDVIRYLRTLEQALIDTVATFGVRAMVRPPHTGIWVGQGKLAAIGVKLTAKGITTHGVALNVTTDLGWFSHIVPCGIANAGVVSLASLGVERVRVGEVAPVLSRTLIAALEAKRDRSNESIESIVGLASA